MDGLRYAIVVIRGAVETEAGTSPSFVGSLPACSDVVGTELLEVPAAAITRQRCKPRALGWIVCNVTTLYTLGAVEHGVGPPAQENSQRLRGGVARRHRIDCSVVLFLHSGVEALRPSMRVE